MENIFRRLQRTPQVREGNHYNVPRRTRVKPVKLIAQAEATAPDFQTAAKDCPDDFWQALSFFLNHTALDAKTTAAIEAHFREIHGQRVAELSLEDIEDLLSARAASQQ